MTTSTPNRFAYAKNDLNIQKPHVLFKTKKVKIM